MQRRKRQDGRYQSRICTGIENGRKQYKYVYARTRRELAAKEAAVKEKLHRGITDDSSLFGYWRQMWLELKRSEVSQQRYLSYRSLSRHTEVLDMLPAAQITSADVQCVLSDCKHLSGASLTALRSTMHQIFALALGSRATDTDPTSAVRVPKRPEHTRRRSLTADERQWIMDTPDPMQLPAMIMMFAGLRRGEVVALRWSDIDTKSRTITVSKAAEVIDGRFTVKSVTKTAAGMRVVSIPRILSEYLENAERGTSLEVFPAAYAKTWSRMWDRYLNKLNAKYGDFSRCIIREGEELPFVIPRFTAHWLRHTFITLMYLSGVDVMTAKEQAGHANVHTTMSVYTHLDASFKAKNIEKLDLFLDEKNVSQKLVSEK